MKYSKLCFSALPPDYKEASFLRLLDSSTHSQHSTIENSWKLYDLSNLDMSESELLHAFRITVIPIQK